MPKDLFVSYSHHDSSLVGPIVKILRIDRTFVFYDVDTLVPAQKWREQIQSAIPRADMFVLFWCSHASSSVEVRKEYRLALKHKKDILPILLDETALPRELAVYQGINFQPLAQSTHQPHSHNEPTYSDRVSSIDTKHRTSEETNPPLNASKRMDRKFSAVYLFFLCTILIGIGYFLYSPASILSSNTESNSSIVDTLSSDPKAIAPPEKEISTEFNNYYISWSSIITKLLLAVGAFFLFVWLVKKTVFWWLNRDKLAEYRSSEMDIQPTGDSDYYGKEVSLHKYYIGEYMAEQIRNELVRRLKIDSNFEE